jgi:hypothetical protein
MLDHNDTSAVLTNACCRAIMGTLVLSLKAMMSDFITCTAQSLLYTILLFRMGRCLYFVCLQLLYIYISIYLSFFLSYSDQWYIMGFNQQPTDPWSIIPCPPAWPISRPFRAARPASDPGRRASSKPGGWTWFKHHLMGIYGDIWYMG